MIEKMIETKDEQGHVVIVERDGQTYRVRETAEQLTKLPDGRLQHPATKRIYAPTTPQHG